VRDIRLRLGVHAKHVRWLTARVPVGGQPRGRGLASTVTTDNICVHTRLGWRLADLRNRIYNYLPYASILSGASGAFFDSTAFRSECARRAVEEPALSEGEGMRFCVR